MTHVCNCPDCPNNKSTHVCDNKKCNLVSEIKHWIVVHHSAGPRNQTAQEIINFDLHRQDLGGLKTYAKIITKDGHVHDFAGEEDTHVAHATGFNTHGIGVCVVGWFDPGHDHIDMNNIQVSSLVQTLVLLCKRHKIEVSNIISHHDTFSMPGGNHAETKSCCGVYLRALLPQIRDKVESYL